MAHSYQKSSGEESTNNTTLQTSSAIECQGLSHVWREPAFQNDDDGSEFDISFQTEDQGNLPRESKFFLWALRASQAQREVVASSGNMTKSSVWLNIAWALCS